MSSQRWPLAKTWTRWTKQAGLGVAGASGLAPSVFLTRKAILIDSGSMKDVPLVSGMRQRSAARRAAPSRSWCSVCVCVCVCVYGLGYNIFQRKIVQKPCKSY